MKTKNVIVHDGSELIETAIDEARFNQLDAFFQTNRQLIGDAADVGGLVGDAGEAISFLVSQLAYTESQVYARQRLPMQFRELLPVSSEAGEWADTIRYESYEGAGQAEFLSDISTDVPEVDVKYGDRSTQVHHAGVGYSYSQQELRQTAYLKRPINDRKLVIAIDAAERLLNRVGLYGDTTKNLPGLFNQTTAPQAIAVNGDWDSASTTVEEILADINQGLNAIYENSAYNDVATDIRVPAQAWTRLVSMARATGSDMTVLNYLRANNMAMATKNIQLNIGPAYGLDTAGAATTGGALSGANSRVVFYVKHPDRIVYHVPMPLKFLAPQLRGYRVLVPGEMRIGGVELRYKNSMFYLDNVLVAG